MINAVSARIASKREVEKKPDMSLVDFMIREAAKGGEYQFMISALTDLQIKTLEQNGFKVEGESGKWNISWAE